MPEPKPTFADELRFHFAYEIERWGWEIGRHSYGRPNVFEADRGGLRIGHFCSIGPGVTILLGNHRTDLVTTYPFAALSEFWPGAEGLPDHEDRGGVRIGSDVWLGANSTILTGITVGDGAVVAAGAVVSRDVPPYAIVAGNPAHVIRHRFPADIVARLLRAAWWTWPDATIAARLPLLMRSDVAAFLDGVEDGSDAQNGAS